MTKQRRWLLWLSIAWGVLLLVVGSYAVYHGAATVKEQRTIDQAQPVVDQATQTVVLAAGPGPAARISGFELRATCRISPVRDGQNYQRTIDFFVRAGQEAELLQDLANKLPKSYRAVLVRPFGRPTNAPGSLVADAGEFVRITGDVTGPGKVQVAMRTGCRPIGSGASEFDAEPDRAPFTDLLNTLDLTPQQWLTHQAGCVSTTVAVGPDPDQRPLSARFAVEEVVIGAADVVVMRDGAATFVITKADTTLTVSRTVTTCQ